MPDQIKIGWFSPVPPAKSEIAAHTERLRPTLEASASVHFWADGLSADQNPLFGQPITQCNMQELNSCDLAIYNIGNHAPAHARIFERSAKRSGIVILHDTYLRHFFAGLYLNEWNDRAGFTDFMSRLYGQEGSTTAEHFLDTHGEHINTHLDCVEACIEHATMTIVHSDFARQSLLRRGVEPLLLPLPFPVSTHPPAKREARPSESPVRVILCGYMGFNRRLLEVLKALREFPEKDAFRFDIYGVVPDELGISECITKYRLEDIVAIRGYVHARTLERALNEADLAINLRYPTMGEASASQLRFWERAIPTLVSRTGWYAEQPSDALAFVRPGHEVEDISRVLKDFLEDPGSFRRLGLRGREHVARLHRPEDYVSGILEAGRASRRVEPVRPALHVADRIGQTCAAWGSSAIAEPALTSAARGIKRMVDGV